MEYGTFDWEGPDGRRKRVRIYYPDVRTFSYDLPPINDPMMIQQLLAPDLQWRLLYFHSFVRPTNSTEELCSLDVSRANLPPNHVPIVDKPEAFKQLEKEISATEWRMMSISYISRSCQWVFFENLPTR